MNTTISGNISVIIWGSARDGGHGMKIKISYTADEKEKADILAADIKKRLPKARIKRSDRHHPYHHLYISSGS